MKKVIDAIKAINPNAEVVIRGDSVDDCEIQWLEKTSEISKEDIFLVSCNHPIITKANQNGLISLKLREIPSFIFLDVKCKIQAKRENIKLEKSTLFKEKQTFQHNLNKKISGPGALVATLSSVLLFYTYIGLIAS